MEEYKGIYYGDETEQKYYEAGAHFKYSKLYTILENIAKERNEKEMKQELLYVNKSSYLNKRNNKKIKKKTRNIIESIDINKLKYNTINNNHNNHFHNHFNIYLSLDEGNKRNKIGNNLSLTNHKKEINIRKKGSTKFKGRPNSILKDRFQKYPFKRKNKLSSSLEQKNINRIRGPFNLKQSIPQFNANISHVKNNHSCNKDSKNNHESNLSSNRNNYNKIRVYKILTMNNNKINNDSQHNISYSNANNKLSLKTEMMRPKYGKKEKIIDELFIDSKKSNKKEDNSFDGKHFVKLSKKIDKKIIVNNNIDISHKTKSLANSKLSNKSKDYKDKDLFINRSKWKKKIKKDFNLTNFSNYRHFKINQFNSLRSDSNNQKKISTEKKLFNLKKIGRNNFININNNQSSFNQKISRSRNYKGKNISFQIKRGFNNNLIDNKIRDSSLFKNYFRTMGDMNMTFLSKTNKKNILNNSKNKSINHKNRNYIYKSNHKNINNKTSIYNNLNRPLKQPYEITPYRHIKAINGLKNKTNLNNSIRVNKKINNLNFQKLNNENISIKIYNE